MDESKILKILVIALAIVVGYFVFSGNRVTVIPSPIPVVVPDGPRPRPVPDPRPPCPRCPYSDEIKEKKSVEAQTNKERICYPNKRSSKETPAPFPNDGDLLVK